MTINTQRLNWKLGQRNLGLPTEVLKRDGSQVAFDIRRIEKAVAGCWLDFETPPPTPVEDVVNAVANAIASRYGHSTPTVEQLQDLVEITLLTLGEVEAARSYMAYRDAHAQQRVDIPAEIREAFDNSALYFPTQIQQFQFFDKYSRFNWDQMHRETWVQTVDRVVDYLRWLVDTHAGGRLPEKDYERIRAFILEQKAMPSMRALAMAGDPAKRNSLAIYNCSYMPVKDPDVFVEALLISMSGCGVGYSVERQYVEQFPRIARQMGVSVHPFQVPDSTDGWAEALRFGLDRWFGGYDVEYDFSKVRKAGTPLLIKGGRASGPEPLKTMLTFVRETILKRQGSFLRTIDAHDMMCAVGQAAVAGGVRRTAMISLFSWDDHEMRDCKNGAWGTWPAIRENANNSAVWPDGLSQIEVVDQMMEMVRGKRGEPGIFSRENANRTKPERRQDAEFGTNPCGEINLRPFGLCNLTIAVARPEDTFEDLREKVEVATIIGTIQSLATEFPGMREDWKANCVEERLLGVDITGQRDCHLLNDADAAPVREDLRDHAVYTNEVYSSLLGINQSASVTCDKPSGNSSQLLNTSSGIHSRWSPYYLRRTRVSATSALYRVLKAAGVPMTPENGQTEASATTWVIAWPMKSPDGAKTRKDFTAVDQCNYWLLNKQHWTEHNPSVTITYQPEEVLPMISWVWEHRDLIGGMAFLPADEAAYEQAPYEEITAEQYEQAVEAFPATLDFALLYAYEHSDMTTAAQELSCMAGNCDV